MDKDDFINNYMDKQIKKKKFFYGMQYLNWLADTEEKAEKLYKAYSKKQLKSK